MLISDDYQHLKDWFDSDLGKSVSHDEKLELAKIITNYFGYHLLHVGSIGDAAWLTASPIRHKIFVDAAASNHGLGNVVQANYQQLPFAPNSIDVALLSHVLEFEKSPEKILQEIADTLIPEGYMIIFGFNPFSLWGIRAWFKKKRGYPWQGHFVSIRKLRKWLRACDCTIDSYKTFCFQLPIASKHLRRHLRFVKSIGQTCWPTNGAIYCLIARKEVATLTPIRFSWRVEKVQFSKKRVTQMDTRRSRD